MCVCLYAAFKRKLHNLFPQNALQFYQMGHYKNGQIGFEKQYPLKQKKLPEGFIFLK